MIVCFLSLIASSGASAACSSCRRPAEKCSCRARNAYTSLARAATQTKGHCLRSNLPRVFTERHRSRATRACRIYLASDDVLAIVDRVHPGPADLCSGFERVFRWLPYQKVGQRVARIFRSLLSVMARIVAFLQVNGSHCIGTRSIAGLASWTPRRGSGPYGTSASCELLPNVLSPSQRRGWKSNA